MNTSYTAHQLNELIAAARTTPTTSEFATSLIAELVALRAAVEDVRDLLTRKVKDFYTVEELADITGRAPFTVRRWIKEGRIEATRVKDTGPKGRLLIARAQLARLVDLGLATDVPDGVLGPPI